MRIIPTIFAKNKSDFILRFNKLIKISKNLQIDFMDGKFVRSKGINLSAIPNLKKYKNNFEAHLMVKNPSSYIDKLKKKGFKKIIFHYSSLDNQKKIENLIIKIKKAKLSVFIAINPKVPVKKVAPFITSVNGILLMGVHPGKEHQKFISTTYNKIKELRKISKRITIQVDGGVNPAIVKKLKKSGLDIANSGSFISESKDPRKALAKLK